MPSIVCRLKSDLLDIVANLADLVENISIEYHDWSSTSVIIIAPSYSWGARSPDQNRAHIEIKQHYEEWFDIFQSVFRNPPAGLQETISETDQDFRQWIELGDNWNISYDRVANADHLRRSVEPFLEVLKIFDANGKREVIVLPDTNALVSQPDPNKYSAIANTNTFTFILLPTVLQELDQLKNLHRNPEYRQKVQRTIIRIKGWRNQGNLLKGVTVNKTITVKAPAREPDMANTLSWLDPINRDDRIIACLLEVQASNPDASLVLVTGDVNLSNKADLARLQTREL